MAPASSAYSRLKEISLCTIPNFPAPYAATEILASSEISVLRVPFPPGIPADTTALAMLPLCSPPALCSGAVVSGPVWET